MPEHLKALLVIMTLATTVFVFAGQSATALAMTTDDFARRRNLWFAITLVAFLAHNFWVYIVAVAWILMYAQLREHNRLAMFYFVLFALPAVSDQISGLGIINHLFTIFYRRLLVLAVLVPAFASLWKQQETVPFGRFLADKMLAGYLVLQFFLMLNSSTFTNALREGVFYQFIDVFLPYYVASRLPRSLPGFREVLMAFVLAATVLCAIGPFESAKHWLLYGSLGNALDISDANVIYLEREDTGLRAMGTAGHAIFLGYLIAVALGFFLYLQDMVERPLVRTVWAGLLTAGLIAPLSRGPWLGAAAMLFMFTVFSASPAMNFAKLAAGGVVVVPALLASPVGNTIIDLLPFVGTIETENVTYRQRLIEVAIGVILDNPLLGAHDYIYSAAMQEMQQGQGIIDIVNSYLWVALGSGLIGLTLYSGFFISSAVGIFKAMRSCSDRRSETYRLGQSLFATLLGILVIIATVSSISVAPIIYWSVAGLGVAYARMVALDSDASKGRSALPTHTPGRRLEGFEAPRAF